MKIAIASQNWITITNHPGKTGRFRVFDADPEQTPRELERLDLAKDMIFHNFTGPGRHPLFEMDLVIAGTAGSGFIQRLKEHGVAVATTAEKDPLIAIDLYFSGTLPAAAAHSH